MTFKCSFSNVSFCVKYILCRYTFHQHASLNLIVALCGQSQISLSPSTSSHIDFSPYPNGYSSGLQCSWTITAPYGYTVQITFESFSLTDVHESLNIYDGNYNLLERYCIYSLWLFMSSCHI